MKTEQPKPISDEEAKKLDQKEDQVAFGISEEVLKQIKSDGIREASGGLFNLAKEVVDSGKNYDFILSDDASGRLVSLYMKKILDSVREKNGLSKVDIRFVAAGRHDNEKIFNEIGEIIKKIEPEQILLVTEHIDTGQSIIKLINVLKSLGIKFDLATLSTRGYGALNVKDAIKTIPESKFYSGSTGYLGLNFYGEPKSGVKKNVFSKDPKPFPVKIVDERMTDEYRAMIQEEINNARKDIDLLADETIKKLGILNKV